MTPRVDTKDLLERIKANREKHKEMFEAAWRGYEISVREWFEARMDELRSGRFVTTTYYTGPTPEDHSDDYDRVIDMLEMETRNEIDIDERQFAQYVRDDWGWKQAFVTSNSTSGYFAKGGYQG